MSIFHRSTPSILWEIKTILQQNFSVLKLPSSWICETTFKMQFNEGQKNNIMTRYLSFYIWTQWFDVLGNIHTEKVTLNGQMITPWKVHRETLFILSAWKFPVSLTKNSTSPEIMTPSSQDHSVCWKTFLFYNKGNITIFFPIH